MRTIANHAKVFVGDHVAGRVTGLVVDPRTMRLTHVAVRAHGFVPTSHLWPLPDLDPREDGLVVTRPAVGAVTRDNEVTFVPIGGWAHPQEDYDPGIVHVLSWPHTLLGGDRRAAWTPADLDVIIDFDRLPKGTVELGGASEVLDATRQLVGHVCSLSVDESGAVVAVGVRRSSVRLPRTLQVPVDRVRRLVNDEVWLDASRHELGDIGRQDTGHGLAA